MRLVEGKMTFKSIYSRNLYKNYRAGNEGMKIGLLMIFPLLSGGVKCLSGRVTCTVIFITVKTSGINYQGVFSLVVATDCFLYLTVGGEGDTN